MIAHCLVTYPEEGCGLLVGDQATGTVASVRPTRNIAASAQVYTVDPREHLRIDREAEASGQEVIGVFHSHTHTDAYPSPTDLARLPILRGTTCSFPCATRSPQSAPTGSWTGWPAEEPIEVH